MAEIPQPAVPTQLIVFADDWGRHPSSSQHLIKELLPQYPTLWVNTVGTRRPRLSWDDLKRGMRKLWNVMSASDAIIDHMDPDLPENLFVIEPMMYPGFRKPWQRRYNRRKLTRAIHGCFGQTFATTPLFTKNKAQPPRRVVVTTLPITADLIETLNVDRWVYYCVDDYSKWPGVDQGVMDAMERELLAKADAVVCVSETLRQRVADMGADDSKLLTHGVEQAMWQTPAVDSKLCPYWPGEDRAIALFWGLIDERMDRTWCLALSQCKSLHAVFVGPLKIDPGILFNADSRYLGPVAHRDLPSHAAASNVLVMPYIDAPVTRAMQPLKLLEYLATMKPVVVRDLPSTRPWADCCDLASTAEQFVQLVAERVKSGTPVEQLEARKRRLPSESWTAKATQLADIINAG